MSEEGESLLACTEEKPGLNYLFQSLIRLVIFDEVIRFLKLAQLVCLSGRCDFDEGGWPVGWMSTKRPCGLSRLCTNSRAWTMPSAGIHQSDQDRMTRSYRTGSGCMRQEGSKVFKAQIMESDLVF